MAWKETDAMKERVKFVLEWEKRWNEGEGRLNFIRWNGEPLFISTALAHDDIELRYQSDLEQWHVVFGPLYDVPGCARPTRSFVFGAAQPRHRAVGTPGVAERLSGPSPLEKRRLALSLAARSAAACRASAGAGFRAVRPELFEVARAWHTADP